MKTIYKYEVPIEDTFSLRLPARSDILCFQIDEKTGLPAIWIKVNTESEYEERRFAIIGTGNPLFSNLSSFIGTVQQNGFVWHLFELL